MRPKVLNYVTSIILATSAAIFGALTYDFARKILGEVWLGVGCTLAVGGASLVYAVLAVRVLKNNE